MSSARTRFQRGMAAALLAAFAAGAPAAAQDAIGIEPPQMEQGGVLDLSVIEALAALKRPELSGVFAFVPESRTSIAFANLLLADPKSRGRYLKFCEKTHGDAGAVSRWDKQVLLLLVGMNGQGELPVGVKPMSDKDRKRINKLALVPGVAIEELRGRSAVRRAR